MIGKRELLTSQRHPDGSWHARYPSAVFTLCGQPCDELGPGRRMPPTCDLCKITARRFHQIDRSMPAHWLPEQLAA